MSACRASMCSVTNEADSFGPAAVPSAREQMVTACNLPASAVPLLGTWTVATAWSWAPALLSGADSQLLQVLQNEGTPFS